MPARIKYGYPYGLADAATIRAVTAQRLGRIAGYHLGVSPKTLEEAESIQLQSQVPRPAPAVGLIAEGIALPKTGCARDRIAARIGVASGADGAYKTGGSLRPSNTMETIAHRSPPKSSDFASSFVRSVDQAGLPSAWALGLVLWLVLITPAFGAVRFDVFLGYD